jgi:hypothetical protein
MSQQNIRDTVFIIQKMIDTEQCKQLEKEDVDKYREMLHSLFTSFATEYPSLFKQIIFRRDLSMLEMMLKKIEDLQAGKIDEKEITTKIGETLAEKYIYPVVGKPETTTEKNPEFIHNK